jgi:GntR family transcriptional regulator
MSVQVKHEAVASSLSRDILRGVLEPGERLAGEHELAARFSVSRGTVRQALAALQRDGLIEKHAGAGSFVTFDGHPLDQGLGWAQALHRHGVRSSTEVLRLEWLPAPPLAAELGLDDARFLALDRRRRLPTGETVSLERSRLPWRPELDSLVLDELRAGSLTTTLAGLGLRPAGWTERVELAWVDRDDAAALDAPVGDPFLSCTRTSYLADGRPLEHVVSLLDPRHFRLELAYGQLP